MSTGTYEEELPCGGKLKVTKKTWEISYYFPGPDLRYNGDFFSIPGNKVLSYIDAYEKNWEIYLKLKKSIPKNGEFTQSGKLGMSIRLGWREGVCIQTYHMPINTKRRLKEITAGYLYACSRAKVIQKMLKSL